jgi:hypothetical protein
MTTAIMWRIKNKRGWQGFYKGPFLTRREAIADHLKLVGGTWKQCYRRNDRAVRVTVTDEMEAILKTLERAAISGIDDQGIMDYEPFHNALEAVKKKVKTK